jgi:hypothetical protein
MKRTRPAFALAIVLWIVAALLLGVAFLSALTRHNLELTRELDDKLQAHLLAQSVVEDLKYYILTSRFDNISLSGDLNVSGFRFPARIVLDGRSYRLGTVRFSLKDLSSGIDVFYPDSAFISRLLTSPRERTRRYTIQDSILDWTDRDNFVRLNGAERAYYELTLHRPYGPRNDLGIQSVDELRLIHGVREVDPALWARSKRHFYTKDRGARYNLALFDEDQLAALLDLNFLEAHDLKRYRETDLGKYIAYLSGLKSFDDTSMGFALSFSIRIEVEAWRGAAHSRIVTTVDFHGIKGRIITYGYRSY